MHWPALCGVQDLYLQPQISLYGWVAGPTPSVRHWPALCGVQGLHLLSGTGLHYVGCRAYTCCHALACTVWGTGSVPAARDWPVCVGCRAYTRHWPALCGAQGLHLLSGNGLHCAGCRFCMAQLSVKIWPGGGRRLSQLQPIRDVNPTGNLKPNAKQFKSAFPFPLPPSRHMWECV
jgi:hypothetical protein